MKKKICLEGKTVCYNLKRYRTSRCVKIILHSNGEVVVTAPFWVRNKFIEKFLCEKGAWLNRKIEKAVRCGERAGVDEKSDYMGNKEGARRLVKNKLTYFNSHYNFQYQRIAIRNQRTLWGSCSSKNNLNFNYRIVFLPEHLQNYLIVHELCHLKELNHSGKFWLLVEEKIPDYKKNRKELKEISHSFLR